MVITYVQGGKIPQVYASSAIPEVGVQMGVSSNSFIYYINPNFN